MTQGMWKVMPIISSELLELSNSGRYDLTMNYLQHGNVSVYEHCIAVCLLACKLALLLRLHINMKELVRGALLHDYFLYDWHEKDASHRLHGFHHASRALANAQKDYAITAREGAIIQTHMFPLTPKPPQTKEAWLVCIADKVCATKETLHLR